MDAVRRGPEGGLPRILLAGGSGGAETRSGAASNREGKTGPATGGAHSCPQLLQSSTLRGHVAGPPRCTDASGRLPGQQAQSSKLSSSRGSCERIRHGNIRISSGCFLKSLPWPLDVYWAKLKVLEVSCNLASASSCRLICTPGSPVLTNSAPYLNGSTPLHTSMLARTCVLVPEWLFHSTFNLDDPLCEHPSS